MCVGPRGLLTDGNGRLVPKRFAKLFEVVDKIVIITMIRLFLIS